ncbi:Wall-associated receptor kinase [Thalictrum thalictroides]|uniref:Wall-associated receptor kinase n=1 Tax=Thalictrum thalictroides TaxID=46969 RepID=A0A7J6WQX9_THATH|nr:Wall-associated receptor kinase [Thalictrum thalictroides]
MPTELLLFFLSWLILVLLPSPAAANRIETLPRCQAKCGNLNIPYPFGIGINCSISLWANIECNTTFHPPRPFVAGTDSIFEVIQISESQVRIKNLIASSCYSQSGDLISHVITLMNFAGTPYTFSHTKNKVTVLGCDTQSYTKGSEQFEFQTACTSICNNREDMIEGSCSGIGCCQTSIPQGLQEIYISVSSLYNYSRVWSFDHCGAAFLGEQDMYTFNSADFSNFTSLRDVPIVLNYSLENKTCHEAQKNSTTFRCKENSHCYDSVDATGYLCKCNDGYAGNAYLAQSCQDVNECEDPNKNLCEGTCTNNVGSYNCSCPDDYYGDGRKDGSGCTKRNKRIPVLQLSLGLGLGLLSLLVCGSWGFHCIKKKQLSKIKEKFFLRNGGLLLKQYISSHEGGGKSTKIFTAAELKLATNYYSRKRILGQGGYGIVYKGILPDLSIVAIKKSKIIDESQVGLFINEITILTQIQHRNVVKLFGCCLETEVPLLVYEFVSNGTLFHHLHDNSKISLSWEDRLRIAAETAGLKPICFERSLEQRNLATYFTVSMNKNHRLFEEAGIIKEDTTEEVHAVSQLAKSCLNLMGDERPSMKEVAARLESLRGFKRQSRILQSEKESLHADYEHVDLYAIPSDFRRTDSDSRLYSLEKQMLGSMNVPR